MLGSTLTYLGCAAVIAKSFARIHETNLKKQGILALTFENPSDYDKIMEDDNVSIERIHEFQSGKSVKCHIHHVNGTNEEIYLAHSYNKSQIEWFHAGSSLNILRKRKRVTNPTH